MSINSPAEFGKGAFALLVGISRFEDQAFRERSLPCAENDASDLRQFLCGRLGWQERNCLVLHGSVSKHSLIRAFNSQSDAARSADKTSLFLFYISTHGQFFDEQDQAQTGVLLASDTILVNLPTAIETGISNQFLSGFLRQTKSLQKLIISDACFAGTATSAHSLTSLSFYSPVDAAVLASSRWESFAAPQSRNSLFTECLMAVLERVQGAVTLPTFFEQLSKGVRERAALLGREQEPVLSHQGGIIVLGYHGATTAPPPVFSFAELLDSCTAILESQLARGDQDGFVSETRYIARLQTEADFWNFVGQSDGKTAFTIVGPAGAGKSTTMAHLALQAAHQGHAVLWFSEDMGGATDPQVPINRFIERLAPTLTLKDATATLPKGKELLVFLDAVNEWSVSPSKARDFLARAMALAVATYLRLVVSCRDNAWTELGKAFTKDKTFSADVSQSGSAGIVSARLAAFSEEELQRALEVYGGLKRFAVGNLARQPLFLRIVSRLAQASDINLGNLSFLEVFDEYLRLRVEKIAKRIMIHPEEVSRAIDCIIMEIAERRGESLTPAVFFAELPELLAVSLLDEGLFKYSGEEIAVETEVVHEHLLSGVLPNDTFASLDRFTSVVGTSRLAPGAVVFRLCRIKDRDVVLTALRWLEQHSPFAVLDALERLPTLNPYWDFFGPWVAKGESFDVLIADALQRRLDLELDFCLKAARAMFVNENYYPWEAKRWRAVSYPEFRKRVSLMRGAPELLAQCAEHQPAIVMSTLLNEWLSDRTPLGGGGGGMANISGTAEIYVAMFGQQFPEIVFPALTRLMQRRPELETSIGQILEHLAHTIPAETARYAAEWAKRLPGMVLTVVAELPKELASAAIPLAREVIQLHGKKANLVESIIAAAARYSSREALDFVLGMKGRRELVNGLIIAITRLHDAFPDECETVARELCWPPDLSDATLAYACSFYTVASARSPETAVQFFRHAAALERPEVAISVSYHLIHLVKSGNSGFQALVEDRLRVEKHYTSLFNYVIALEQYRTLQVEDLEWLRRWIAFPSFRETDFVLELLMASHVPPPEIMNIVFLMEKEWASLENAKPSPRLRKLAEEVVQDTRFASLREYSKRIWRMVAQGENPTDASRAALDALIREKRTG